MSAMEAICSHLLEESAKSPTKTCSVEQVHVSAAALEQFFQNKVKIWQDLSTDVSRQKNKDTNITDFDTLETFLEVLM
jgi:hypothetical protein